MYPVLKIMHMLNFLDTFSMGVTEVIIPWGQIPPIRNLAEVATSGDKTYQSTIWQEFSSIKTQAEIAINQST